MLKEIPQRISNSVQCLKCIVVVVYSFADTFCLISSYGSNIAVKLLATKGKMSKTKFVHFYLSIINKIIVFVVGVRYSGTSFILCCRFRISLLSISGAAAELDFFRGLSLSA